MDILDDSNASLFQSCQGLYPDLIVYKLVRLICCTFFTSLPQNCQDYIPCKYHPEGFSNDPFEGVVIAVIYHLIPTSSDDIEFGKVLHITIQWSKKINKPTKL